MEKSENIKSKDLDYRTIFVGDDTGLLKKVKFTMRVEQDIISAPGKKRIRNKRTLDQMLFEEQQ